MERTNSVVVASIWMVVINLALFFLPLVNALIGGAVGGYKVGDWKKTSRSPCSRQSWWRSASG